MTRCSLCKKSFKTNTAFETHAPVCTGLGKPLGEMSTEELMAAYEANQKKKG